MEVKTEWPHVGVVVGRFQVASLHEGHMELLKWVSDSHSVMIVVIGCNNIPNSFHNPIPFEPRKQMIQAAFPNALIFQLFDSYSDEIWSNNLDAIVKANTSPFQKTALYGSRDSFIQHYKGKFLTVELDTNHQVSGTVHREDVAYRMRDSEDFRAGLIAASRMRYPVSYCTVDIACFNEDATMVVMGKKKGETLWRFPGGFSDPDGTSHFDDAKREFKEECGAEVSRLEFIASVACDDWRYRKGPDKIKTLLFAGWHLGNGDLSPNDDLEVVAWLPIEILNPLENWQINPVHRKLAEKANFYINRKLEGVK